METTVAGILYRCRGRCISKAGCFFNPQFFGEDGSVWYANAYPLGWLQAFFHSQNGYFQTLPRLAASLALLVDLRFAPLIMNLIGIAFQVLPVNLLLSVALFRMGPAPGPCSHGCRLHRSAKLIELNASVEEGQWHLALAASILVLS